MASVILMMIWMEEILETGGGWRVALWEMWSGKVWSSHKLSQVLLSWYKSFLQQCSFSFLFKISLIFDNSFWFLIHNHWLSRPFFSFSQAFSFYKNSFMAKLAFKVYDMHQLENILGNFSENVSATLTLAPNSKVYLLYERLVLLYSSMEGKYLQHFSFRLESGSRIYNNIPRHKWRAHFKNLQILFQLSRSKIEKILINPVW